MTIKNFDANITTFDGLPLTNSDGKEVNLPVSHQIAEIVRHIESSDRETTGNQKYELAALAIKIKKGGDTDFSRDELDKIKEKVGKYGSPDFVYQVFNILEGKETTDTTS
jgi:hypothetical protein